jgi:hypothetical protein
MGNSPEQLACIESNSIQALEIGDMAALVALDPVIFYSMSKLISLKVISSWFLNHGFKIRRMPFLKLGSSEVCVGARPLIRLPLI